MDFSWHLRMTLNSLRYLLSLCVNVLIMILVVYTIGQICIRGYHFCYEIFGSVVVEDAPGSDREFVVDYGETMYEVSERLEEDGLIVNRYSFYLRTQFMEEEDVVLKPGSYVLNTSMDYKEIIDQLTVAL